jgi:hypothetical protein
MMGLYLDAAGKDGNELLRWFNEAWKKSGKKLDMGKACIRFKSLDELPLDVIGEAIRRVPAKKYVETYLRIRAAPRMSRAEIQAMVKEREAKKSSAAGQKKSAAKKTSEGKRPAPKKAVKKAAR